MGEVTISFTLDTDHAAQVMAFVDLLDDSDDASFLLQTEYAGLVDEILQSLPWAFANWEEFRLGAPHLPGLYSVLALIERNRRVVIANAGPIYELIFSLIPSEEDSDDATLTEAETQ